MPGATERYIAFIEAMKGEPATPGQLDRIAEAYMREYWEEFQQFADDPANPTNAEKAGFVVQKTRKEIRRVLRRPAEKDAFQAVKPDIENAGDQAESDL